MTIEVTLSAKCGRSPVSVNVPDDTILISLLSGEAPLEILTLISTL